jgi:hypothetical protein
MANTIAHAQAAPRRVDDVIFTGHFFTPFVGLDV